MQEKVDYLSKERRLDHVKWEKNIFARIKSLEREQHMDLSAG